MPVREGKNKRWAYLRTPNADIVIVLIAELGRDECEGSAGVRIVSGHHG